MWISKGSERATNSVAQNNSAHGRSLPSVSVFQNQKNAVIPAHTPFSVSPNEIVQKAEGVEIPLNPNNLAFNGQTIQRVWEKGIGEVEVWNSLIEGVQWYKKGERLWFEDKNKDRRFAFWEGQIHSYTEQEWDNIELDISTPEVVNGDVIDIIRQTKLTGEFQFNIGSSRPKPVYLFTADGSMTKNKALARYMIDTSMSKDEVANYNKVRDAGLRVPTIYGSHTAGVIIQFLPNQSTVTAQQSGSIAKAVDSQIKKLRMLQKINKQAAPLSFWNPRAWRSAMVDLNLLITTGYRSSDLQFMVDNDSGHIYLMDMEPDKPPYFDKPDNNLILAKEIIEKYLAEDGV